MRIKPRKRTPFFDSGPRFGTPQRRFTTIVRKGDAFGEFVDQGWKDISMLAQIRVFPTKKQDASKQLLVMKRRRAQIE